MTFRTKLLFISSFTAAGAVALVTGAVAVSARRAFERMDGQRREALLTQLRTELDARGAELGKTLDRAASSVAVQQLVSGAADYDRATAEAETESLDFLDVLQPDLTIISSAHWPARFGYKNNWPLTPDDWKSNEAFLTRIPLPDGNSPALIAVRRLPGDKGFLAGGKRITPEFLKSLGQAPGMRALLWVAPDQLPGQLVDSQGGNLDSGKLVSLIGEAQRSGTQETGIVQWTGSRSSAESLLALPLVHSGSASAVLLAGTSLAGQLSLEQEILWIGISVAGAGILLGILLGWWTTERVTHPIGRLVDGARSVAGGDWSARVDVISKDEIGELARAFNQMTEQLLEQRDRAIQAERVAAWRELARRLAHELKNPLFPLQITIENLQRARSRSGADLGSEFDEVFRESTATLLTELSNLKTIVGRFSDFARMPPPAFDTVDANEIVRGVMKLHDARFASNGRPQIETSVDLASGELKLEADGEQLRRALGNLVLNAIDAMPEGGTLRVSSSRGDDSVRLSVSDTGQGLTEEECSRLFTPYYTTKQHGTGLGLAIVQSVVSDHHGKISVVSEPGKGATFVIDLPLHQGASA